LIEFNVGSSFSGLKLRCWDKHKFRSDKFMGQVTIKFNTQLLSSTEQLDDWFPLKKRKSKESISGEVHMQIQYGDLKTSNNLTRDHSATISEQSTVDLKVSPNFNTEETNIKLRTSTHVIVDEEEEEGGDKEEEQYDRIREGPATAALEKATKDEKDAVFGNKNLEITNNSSNYYTVSWAKGNVRVNGGKWYFEVRIITTGQMQIGWCTANFNPKINSPGDSWTYDGSRQNKFRNNNAGTIYGEYWTNGDVIGCSLDVDTKSIQYWRNGKDLGVAFNDVNTGGGRLTPIIGVAKRAKCQFNFGKDTFAFPQDSFNILHSFLTEKELETLGKLFAKYRDIGNNALIAEKKEEIQKSRSKEEEDGSTNGEPDVDLKESIHGNGLLEFQKDLAIVEDDDPTMMIIAWKLKTETLWEISRDEFMNGYTVYGCATIDKMKAKAREWLDDTRKKEQEFKHFYNFVFDYLKEDKKILLLDEALAAWGIVFKERSKWPMWPDFEQFLKDEDKKSISRDAWQQLYHFKKAYPKDLSEYDPMSSWPIIFDEFVEWMEAKGKK